MEITPLEAANDPMVNMVSYLDDRSILAMAQGGSVPYALVAERLPIARYFLQTKKAARNQIKEAQDDMAYPGVLTSTQLRILFDRMHPYHDKTSNDISYSASLILTFLRLGWLPDENKITYMNLLLSISTGGFSEDLELVLRTWEQKPPIFPNRLIDEDEEVNDEDDDNIEDEFIRLVTYVSEIATPSQFERFAKLLLPDHKLWKRYLFGLIENPRELYYYQGNEFANTTSWISQRVIANHIQLLSADWQISLEGPYGYSRVLLYENGNFLGNYLTNWYDTSAELARLAVGTRTLKEVKQAVKENCDDIKNSYVKGYLEYFGQVKNMDGETPYGLQYLLDRGESPATILRKTDIPCQELLDIVTVEQLEKEMVDQYFDVRRLVPLLDVERRAHLACLALLHGDYPEFDELLAGSQVMYNEIFVDFAIYQGLVEAVEYLRRTQVGPDNALRYSVSPSQAALNALNANPNPRMSLALTREMPLVFPTLL